MNRLVKQCQVTNHVERLPRKKCVVERREARSKRKNMTKVSIISTIDSTLD